MWYDFYSTRCVFSIPSPRLGERNHTARWIKIISHHKTWEILYLSHIFLDINVMSLVIIFWYHTVFLRNAIRRIKSTKSVLEWYTCDEKNLSWIVIWFMSNSLCFLSPHNGSGIKKYSSLDKNYITPQTMGSIYAI
jgi:hypothetical protein